MTLGVQMMRTRHTCLATGSRTPKHPILGRFQLTHGVHAAAVASVRARHGGRIACRQNVVVCAAASYQYDDAEFGALGDVMDADNIFDDSRGLLDGAHEPERQMMSQEWGLPVGTLRLDSYYNGQDAMLSDYGTDFGDAWAGVQQAGMTAGFMDARAIQQMPNWSMDQLEEMVDEVDRHFKVRRSFELNEVQDAAFYIHHATMEQTVNRYWTTLKFADIMEEIEISDAREPEPCPIPTWMRAEFRMHEDFPEFNRFMQSALLGMDAATRRQDLEEAEQEKRLRLLGDTDLDEDRELQMMTAVEASADADWGEPSSLDRLFLNNLVPGATAEVVREKSGAFLQDLIPGAGMDIYDEGADDEAADEFDLDDDDDDGGN